MNKAAQLDEAKSRAKILRSRLSARETARRMAAEFDICIYCVLGTIYGSFFETDKSEVVRIISV